MPESISPFKTPEGEAQYLAAYDATLAGWPVPPEDLYVSTRLGDTHILACGPREAPPLILLHCMLGSATVWGANIVGLSQHFRTYAVDVIGEPNKSLPTRPAHNERDLAAWMVDVFDALQIQRAHLVGNSFGGFLSLSTAAYAPDRVGRIVLLSPAATFTQIWAFYLKFFLPFFILRSRQFDQAMQWLKQGLPLDERWERQFILASLHGLPLNRVYPRVFSDDELRCIHTPTLLLVGDREVIYQPRKAVERALRVMPDIQAEIVPHAHHVTAMARPEWVNARILPFLQ